MFAEKKKVEGGEADDEPASGDLEVGKKGSGSKKTRSKGCCHRFGAENLKIFTQVRICFEVIFHPLRLLPPLL